MRYWPTTLIFIIGCNPPQMCYQNHYQTLTNYAVNATETTPEGIGVDSSGQAVDLAKIDRLTDELEACLRTNFADDPAIPADAAAKADCRTDGVTPKTNLDPNVTVKRECLTVKIPTDWIVSACSGEEVLLLPADDAFCLAKGITPTPECPCRWRVATQDDNTIVSPPGLKLYKAELARIVTGCNNVWVVPQITACL